jgi:hypothetical protein
MSEQQEGFDPLGDLFQLFAPVLRLLPPIFVGPPPGVGIQEVPALQVSILREMERFRFDVIKRPPFSGRAPLRADFQVDLTGGVGPYPIYLWWGERNQQPIIFNSSSGRIRASHIYPAGNFVFVFIALHRGPQKFRSDVAIVRQFVRVFPPPIPARRAILPSRRFQRRFGFRRRTF